MKASWLIAACLMMQTSAAWSVNKCVAKDGTVSFQDAPCSKDAQSKEAIKVREQGTISAAGSYGVAHLDMTGSPTQRFVRAAAALETLADLSTDCKIKLQVYGAIMEVLDICKRFTTHHQAWWKPATETLSDLMDDRAWATENIQSVERTTRHISKVNSNAEFILLRMKASR